MALGSSRSSLPAFSSLGPRAASRVAWCIRAQAVGTVEEDIRFACSLNAGSQGLGLGSGMSWREDQELRGLGPALGDTIKVSLDPSGSEVLASCVLYCLFLVPCLLGFPACLKLN